MTHELTPTEDLVMEVLAARARTGELIWTFDRRHRKAVESLARQGLVYEMSGVVERTIRAGLTDAGKAEYLKGDFQTPEGRQIEKLEVELREVRALNEDLFRRAKPLPVVSP